MNKILEGLDGVVCLVDDVLVFGADKDEHYKQLEAVLKHIEEVKLP